MKIIKLIAISIVEREAEKRLTETRMSLAEKFGKCMLKEDWAGADIIEEAIKIRVQRIRDWENKWKERIGIV